MFTDQLTRAIAAARTLQLDQRSTPDIRAARSRTRRRLHEPRPPVTPEIRARIGQWKAQIKAACLAGYISKGGDKYLHELLTIHSVARGDYCLYSDKEMAQRINIKGRTIRQHRKDADIHGLVPGLKQLGKILADGLLPGLVVDVGKRLVLVCEVEHTSFVGASIEHQGMSAVQLEGQRSRT